MNKTKTGWKKERETFEKLKSLCSVEGSRNQNTISELKKFYMNKYGNYMTARIISMLLLEFFALFAIMQSGIDRMWEGIPYADTIIYGTMWCSGGIYLAQMVIRVIYATYDLKLSLESGHISYTIEEVSLDNKAGNQLNLYIKEHKKNKPFSISMKKSIHSVLHSNINNADIPGTRLVIYHVDNKRGDIFIMVKDRPISDTPDRIIRDTIQDKVILQKAKWYMIKNRFKKSQNKPKKKE